MPGWRNKNQLARCTPQIFTLFVLIELAGVDSIAQGARTTVITHAGMVFSVPGERSMVTRRRLDRAASETVLERRRLVVILYATAEPHRADLRKRRRLELL